MPVAFAPVLSLVPAAAPWSVLVVPAVPAALWPGCSVAAVPCAAPLLLEPLLAELFWSELPAGALFCAISMCGGVVWLPELVVSGGVVVEGDVLVPGVVLVLGGIVVEPVEPVVPVEPVPAGLVLLLGGVVVELLLVEPVVPVVPLVPL